MPTVSTNTAPSFNLPRTGIASVQMGEARAMALQSDSIFLGGASYTGRGYDFSVVKLNTDGSLDTRFSGDGKNVIDLGGNNDVANSVVMQSDGKLVLGGYSGTLFSYDFSAVRLNTDGSLDTSFSGDGKVVTNVGSDDAASCVVVQSDGRLVLSGSSGTDFSVIRLNTDGSLDTSFSGDGKVVIDVGGDDRANSMVLQSDGKLVLGGYSWISSGTTSYDFSAVRLNTDGSLDTSFSGDGKAVFDLGDYDIASIVMVQSDGKLVLGGYSYSGSYADFSAVRLNTDGSLDTGFGGDGKVVIDLGGDDRANSMVLQSDGKLVLAGNTGVVRLSADGSLDTSFSGDGISTVATNIHTVRVLADGKLLLGSGSSVTRLNADGSLDTSFGDVIGGGSANTLGSSVAYTEQAAPVILDSSVQILDAELTALNGGAGNYAGANITLARHGGAKTQDVFSAGSGLSVLTQGSYLAVNGTTIGRVTTNSGGTLTLTFSAAATQTLVNQALSSIAYSNTSDGPPASVQIDWTFNDGNTTGSQGAGNALSTTGSSTVNITAINDGPPTLANPLADMKLVAGQAFSQQVPATTFSDPDGEALTYTVANVDGTGLPPWLAFDATTRTFSGTPDALDAGMRFDVRLSARDASGATASDVFTVQVGNANNAPTISGIPASAQSVTTGTAAALADFTVADADGAAINLTVTLTPTNGTLGNLTDANTSLPGIQLSGTAAQINTAIAGATFTSTTAGAASIGVSVSDGVANPATATYSLSATGGINTITGDVGNNLLNGTANADTLSGLGGNDTLNGGAGADSLDGGTGTDTASYADATTPVSVILYGGQAFGVSSGNDTLTAIENILGSAYGDLIFGDAADNVLDGGAGNDTLDGALGNDTLLGQTGDDLLNGLAGNDSLDGGDGADSLYGWADNDNLAGGTGADRLFGGAGNDRLDGGADADQLEGDDGADTLLGSAGNDTLRGWNDNDSLDGGEGDNALFGGTGADSMQAGSGADQLEGDDGNDTIAGGAGNDTLRGWNDADSLDGGDGNDALFGGAGADAMQGGSGADQLEGDDGNDTIAGGVGNDTLRGWNDSDNLSGDDGDDLLVGWSGNDSLVGGLGDDSLFGDDGADTLVGGAGGDVLQGGLGNDVYVFATGYGFDGVRDYDYLAGNSDTFQFTGINRADLSFARVGDALKVERTASAGADVIYVNDWYQAGSNGAFKIETWIMGDASVFTAAQIEALV